MGLLATLDRFVHVTRLDFMTPYSERRPRNLRWLPLAVLVALVAGYAVQIGAARVGWSPQFGFAGTALFVLALVAASLIRLFGPRLASDAAGPLDEREHMLNARANAVSGMLLVWLVVLACFYFAFAATFPTWWMPTSAIEWAFLGLGLQGAALTLPVLVASWLQPALDEEE